MATTAVAHPNIALIKYWGKQERAGNLPATPNLSITLDTLQTETTVEDAADGQADTLFLNGEARQDAKVEDFLKALRRKFVIPPLTIRTSNNFPTGAGLASSASGFAALVTAINEHAQMGLNAEYLSEWARLGSASAARSVLGGFVSLVPPLWRAAPAAPADYWPLHTVVAVTSTAEKQINSTRGMGISRDTSPYYNAWVRGSGDDYAAASMAIEQRDFGALASVAEQNCLKMHSVMQTSQPCLLYWNPATVACMHTVQKLRAEGVEVFFTIDAGPQVKAICSAAAVTQVAVALESIEGVIETFTCGIGQGARIIN